MPWLEFKNGLLLKLASVLHTLAAWLTPEAHAPGPQADDHPQVENDWRAQWKEQYKVSRPPEHWLKLVAENSSDDSSERIGGKVDLERPQFVERHAAVEPARKIAKRQRGLAPALGHGKQSRSSQQPQSSLAGPQPKPEMTVPEKEERVDFAA